MAGGFKFGSSALGWLRGYKLDDEQISNIERAVALDLSLERLSRPVKAPSQATLLRRQARQYERLARKVAGR